MFNQKSIKMSKRILNDVERKELLAKYKAEKLNDAPANITDATLIKNFGSDEQKALLETAEKPGETKKDESTTNGGAENAGNSNDGNVDGAGAVTQSTDEQKAQAELDAHDANTESPEYITELNNYLSLNEGKAPESQLKLSELRNANIQRISDLQNVPSGTGNVETKQSKPNLQSTFTNKTPDKVELVNKTTGQVKRFTVHTYQKYLVNDKEWVLNEPPAEVKRLLENG